jgi:hypothetical protein
MFIRVREQAFEALSTSIRELGLGLSQAQIDQLATYAIAGADGLFMAHEIGGDTVDLIGLFRLHGQALYDTAVRMSQENEQ